MGKDIIINGIDVSRPVLTATNNDIYYSQKVVDELQNNIKRLQEENKDLKTYIQKMDKPEIKTIDSEVALKNIELQQENEKIKEKVNSYSCNANCYKYKEADKYKQALEEIREILMCKIYNLNENASQLDYMCYALDKFGKIRIKILTKINEVLNDRN